MTQPLLSTAAAGPLLDIDGTVFIQFFIFMGVWLLGGALLFKPYLRLRERRAEGIEGARKESENMQAEAEAKLADYQLKMASARSRANEEKRRIRQEAAAYENEVTETARAETTAALDEARNRVQQETQAARQTLGERSAELAQEIASKLLGRKVA